LRGLIDARKPAEPPAFHDRGAFIAENRSKHSTIMEPG
jgi:hypothetical protein